MIRFRPACTVSFALVLVTSTLFALQVQESAPHPVMPLYDDDGSLLLPDDYREWTFVGSSLGLSYTEGAPSHEMFHHTLMEPSAYEHFTRTGEFREGTMLVLMLHGTGNGELPQRRGLFAAEIHGIEMAVKDSSHLDEGWGYYNFGGMNGIRDRVRAMARNACYDCHAEHARKDNVFLQFYPLLEEAAPGGTSATASSTSSSSGTDSLPAPLAIRGLDPVMLIDGRDEMGKPEIEMVYEGYRYQFVAEPTRARFEADPERYSLHNDSCPVLPGAPIDPYIFTVYEGRIYGFATEGCLADFRADPARYIESESGR